ncbi:glycerophosphodiester phosphodiesterase 1 isoform X2 [Pocillopora verrucosa]|uniref:glycerophosphodiester phosphodiesterase 1 isoform X2 n=1 Tax=Pocillopora verrucosa TaxID=203993 RepID=UPI00279747EB|nr:glycerophosphodiester phosphodiesterase 1-like isoform X2 [Pocillopora verrucosa]
MFVMIVEMALTAVSYGLHIYFAILLIFLSVMMFILYRLLRFPRPTPYTVSCFLRRGALSRSSPVIIGHRGCSLEAPENTLAAFKLAKENGAQGVEFDLDFTKDGVPVIIHDSTVDRTTDGHGKVRDFTYEEIRRLNASAKHPNREKFPDERIPHLQEVVDLCVNLGLQMYIDVKAASQAGKAASVLKNLFASHQLYDKAIVCSFYPNVIFQIIVVHVDTRSGGSNCWPLCWTEYGSFIFTPGFMTYWECLSFCLIQRISQENTKENGKTME